MATPPGPSVGIYKMKIGYKEKILRELKTKQMNIVKINVSIKQIKLNLPFKRHTPSTHKYHIYVS